MNSENFIKINRFLRDEGIAFEVKTIEDLKTLVEKLGGKDEETAEIVPETKEIIRMIPFEELADLHEAFLEKIGIVFSEEKERFIDLQEGREYEPEKDATSIVSEEFAAEFKFFFEEEAKEVKESYAREWRRRVLDELYSLNAFLEIVAERASEMFSLPRQAILGNLRSRGKIGAGIRDCVLGISSEILEFRDPETDEWLVPKALEVSRFRHEQTNYDLIDKSFMNEFEVEELRKEKNRERKEENYENR